MGIVVLKERSNHNGQVLHPNNVRPLRRDAGEGTHDVDVLDRMHLHGLCRGRTEEERLRARVRGRKERHEIVCAEYGGKDYARACEAERAAVAAGDRNFKGVGF